MFNLLPYRNNHMTRQNRGTFEDFANDFFRPFFAEGFNMMEASRPMRVDVKDEGDHFLLEADLPGMKKDDLNVEVNDGVLTISATTNASNETKDEQDRYIYRERRTQSVTRSFDVEGIREGEITAEFKDGVLRLNLPKAEPVQQPEVHTITIE